MPNEYVVWGLGVVQAIVAGGLAWNLRSHGKHHDNHSEVIIRLTRLETMWSMISKQAAEILHSPHFKESGFDDLLEKLVKTYENRHYELSLDEWNQLLKLSQDVKEDMEEPKGTRLLAAMVYAQCCHKLSVMT